MSRTFLFLSVNSSYSHSSLALPLLHSAAVGVKGWKWIARECTIAEDAAQIAAELAAEKPDIAGCSLYLFNRDAVLDILSRFHKLSPHSRIILGGPECSGRSASEIIEKYSFVHTVFRGEAEQFFADFLNDFSDVAPRGIIPSDGSAVYDAFVESSPVDDLFFCTGKAFVQMETSRGCPMRCKYCTSCNIPLRMKELSFVEKEISSLHSKGVREVRLLDRTFNFPPERGAVLLKLFRQKFSDIEFHLEIHPQFLNDELKKELAAAPNLHIEAGIQSFDADVQRAIGRNSRKEVAVEGVKFLASCKNFETHIDLICGLPQQTCASVFEDVSELISLRVNEIQLETLKILHGTPLAEDAEKLGIIYSSNPPYDVMQTPTFSADEILLCRKLSRVLDMFYNHNELRGIILSLNFSNGGQIRDFLDFMLARGVDLKCVSDLKKRVLFLAEYVKKYPDADAAFEIGKVWIRQGYPMNAIPFGEVVRREEKIESACSGCGEDILNHRETKIWRFICGGKSISFAVNRHFKLNGAALFFDER